MSIIKFNFEQKSKIKLFSPSFSKNEENIDENIGNTKNNFIPLQIIGEGAFGKIIKVKSKINNKIYVLKILKKENQRAAVTDIIFLTRLKHPNIVKYYKYFEDNTNYYIILEYINGQTLFDLFMSYKIQKIQIEEKIIWNILAQCLNTLINIHGKGVIHRDIKPLNIMYDEKNKIKIIDFNSSAFMDVSSANANGHNYELMINHGTEIVNNMEAPEISTGNYNAKVDVYPLGKIISSFILYNFDYMYSFSIPYSGELLTIIDKMVIENPEQRPTINEIDEKYFQKYYSIKYFKYSSIFSCLHCLFNYPIWTKIISKNKKIKNNYLISFLKLFKLKNKDGFEEYVKEFKIKQLKLIFENNDKSWNRNCK